MRKIIIFFQLVLLLCCIKIHAQNDSTQIQFATKKFKEIIEICNADNGKLWGKNLASPILIINRDSRLVIANEPDVENLLKKVGDVYIGYFPENKIIANSTTELGGKYWTMVGYPMDEDEFINTETILHEMFHHLQKAIGLDPIAGYNNNHLDNIQARIYLKLEWLALEKGS